MKKYFYSRVIVLSLLLLGSFSGFSQVVLTADSVTCGATSDTIRATLIGDVPTSTGITADDGYSSSIPIGFTFNFYGTDYTHCVIGSNGNIRFDVSYAGGGDPWPISAVLHGNSSVYNSICGPWCDMQIYYGGTITYSTIGTAPYRKFAVTYCTDHMYSCTSQYTTSQMIIYETTNIIEVHIAHKTICASWNGGHAIVGVQNSSGTASTAAPGRDYPSTWTATDEAWRFSPMYGDTAYTVSSISYAPVPYSSSSIYWYDSTTHAYLGSGSSIAFTPSVGDSCVYAVALGCADSSYTFLHLDLLSLGGGSSPVHITTTSQTDPTICGVCNGTVSLIGVNPGQSDTIFYSYAGVPQTIIVDSAGADSTITIRGLCAGTYDYFYVKVGPCPSNSVGPLTLHDPSFTISSVSHTNPTICGACDGTITLHGLVPGFSDTINYSLGGVPQPAVVFTVGSSGSVTLTGLPAGNYTNITATMNYCVTPPVSTTLTNPAFGIGDTSHTNASCSACDGTFTLHGLVPGQSVTVSYNFNGTPQTPYTGTTSGSGTITLTGLCPGNYDNIVATLNTCVSGACVSSPVGTIVIVPPPLIPIWFISSTNATECGACNGMIVLKGMTPGSVDTIFYDLNGVTQTPVIYSAGADSSITMYGLCKGDYSNFFVKVGPCPTTTISTHAILVDPPIIPNFSDNVRYGCNGDTVTFTNSSTSAGALYYIWHFGDGYTDTAVNPSHIYPQGSYNVTLIATNHHCVDSTSNTISLIHPIQAIFAPSAGIVCQNTPVTFANTSIGTPPYYRWSFGDGTFDTVANPSHTYANVGTYTIQLRATNFVPCADSITSTVVVDSQTIMSLSISDSAICSGTYVSLNGTYTSIGNTGIIWNFSDGDTIKNVNPVSYAYPAAGSYTVIATATYRACNPVSVSHSVNVYAQPNINLGPDTSICLGGETGISFADNLNAHTTGATWMWSTGETTPAITVVSAGCYAATVTINGCEATDSVCVASDCYMAMPDIFSPNGDGVNDYFYPRSALSAGLVTFKMDIYNRWGQLIFETNSVEGRGWDGKWYDVLQPEGVYIFKIDASFKDGKIEHHTGNITMIR